MNSSKVGIFLGCAGVAIAVALGVLFMSGDHEGPVVTFAKDVPTYKQGEEKEDLLKNVEAYDAVDKDVTDMVIVDTVTPLEDNKTARVVYVAKDKSNNVTKASQTVAYTVSEKQSDDSDDSEDAAKAKDSTVVAARSAAAQDTEKKTGSASDTRADSTEKIDSAERTDSAEKADSTQETDSTEKADSTEGTDSTEKADSTRTADSTEKADNTQKADSTAQQYLDVGTSTGYAYTLEDSAVTEEGQVFTLDPTEATGSTEPAKPGDPVLTLRTNRVTLQRGQNFSYSEYVKDVTDDKDDYYGLFRRISVKGDYNTQVPGTYTIEYTVTDTEGNTSPAVPLVLTVK